MTKTCGWCETPLTGRQKRWCSENCRKRAHDDTNRASCSRCNAPMYASSGSRGSEHCATCHRTIEALAHRARVEDVAEMYREGKSMREISAILGHGPNSMPHEVNEAFNLGILRPDEHRYDLDRCEAIRQGMAAARGA